MINENQDNTQSGDFQSEANGPMDEAGRSGNANRIKDVGLKGLGPVLDVIKKYRGDLNPYFSAISKALQAGVDSLTQENATEADHSISNWLKESSTWFEEARGKLESKSGSDLLKFLEDEAQRRPGLMFGISYLAGMGVGRLGRYVGQAGMQSMGNQQENTSPTEGFTDDTDFDSTIH